MKTKIKKEKKVKKQNEESTAIQKVEQQKELITKELLVDYLKTFTTGSLTEQEANQFIHIALAYQLNPFKREIYCIPYNTQQGRHLSIITGYETYLKRADRLRVLSGWNVITSGDGDNLKAIITIHRKDWRQPFVHEVFLREYNQRNRMWNDKPITMIKKVAVAQGFRLAFPDEFGGMPYTQDELPDNMTENNIIPIKVPEIIPENENYKKLVELAKTKNLNKDDFKFIMRTEIGNSKINITDEEYNKLKNVIEKMEIKK